jgi:magnesium transporter
VTIRSLGVGDVNTDDTLKILRRELTAGVGIALALGSMMVLIAALLWTSPTERWVAFVAGAVMALNTLAAVTLGTMLPMAFKRLNLDPALLSGPLVTTMLDSIGFILFFSIISIALNVWHLSI